MQKNIILKYETPKALENKKYMGRLVPEEETGACRTTGLYLTLPYGEDVLPPSDEASNGPNAHPRINHEVTKSPSVASTHLGPQ